MFKRKAQSTVEYAMIIAVVVGGLLLMQHYVRRGLAGRYRSSSDDLGEQFDPTAHGGVITINQSSDVRQTLINGTFETKHNKDQKSLRTGNESISNYSSGADLFTD